MKSKCTAAAQKVRCVRTSWPAPARTQAIGIAIVGLAFSLLWLPTAIGREKYIRRWRAIVERVDKSVDPYNIYNDIEQRAKRDLLNPSVIGTYVPAFIALVWVAVLVRLTLG